MFCFGGSREKTDLLSTVAKMCAHRVSTAESAELWKGVRECGHMEERGMAVFGQGMAGGWLLPDGGGCDGHASRSKPGDSWLFPPSRPEIIMHPTEQKS